MSSMSKVQMDRLRAAYAILLATKHSGRVADALFGSGFDPEYIRIFDVLKRRWDEYRSLLSPLELRDLSKSGRLNIGLFKIRKTRKGYIVSADIARVRIKT